MAAFKFAASNTPHLHAQPTVQRPFKPYLNGVCGQSTRTAPAHHHMRQNRCPRSHSAPSLHFLQTTANFHRPKPAPCHSPYFYNPMSRVPGNYRLFPPKPCTAIPTVPVQWGYVARKCNLRAKRASSRCILHHGTLRAAQSRGPPDLESKGRSPPLSAKFALIAPWTRAQRAVQTALRSLRGLSAPWRARRRILRG